MTAEDVSELKECLDLMDEKDLRHIDFLIYLMNHYNTAAPHLLQSIFEILKEDETNLKNLMRNFT